MLADCLQVLPFSYSSETIDVGDDECILGMEMETQKTEAVTSGHGGKTQLRQRSYQGHLGHARLSECDNRVNMNEAFILFEENDPHQWFSYQEILG